MMTNPMLLCFVVVVGAVYGQQLETESGLQNDHGSAGQTRLSSDQSTAVLQQILHGQVALGSPGRLVSSSNGQALETGDKRSFRNGVGKREDARRYQLPALKAQSLAKHHGTTTELETEATMLLRIGGQSDTKGAGELSDKRSFRNGVGKRTHFHIVADASLDGLGEPETLRQSGNDVSTSPISRDQWKATQEEDEGQCSPCGPDGEGVCVVSGVCCHPDSGCVLRKDVCPGLPDHTLCTSRQHSATCRTGGKCVAPGVCCRAADSTCSLAPECD